MAWRSASATLAARRSISTRGAQSRRFVDRVRILVAGGDGGDGMVSRFRDSRVENGPPNGGNGGHGGDIMLRACHDVGDPYVPRKLRV